MDAVTYPKEEVSNFINKNVIPLRVPSDQQPISTDFKVNWTPALLILDQEGNEHYRTIGFMGAEELIPSIWLGIGNSHFDGNNFEEALSCYEKLLADYSRSDSAPEAIFQKGVSLYKSTNDPKPLKEAYEQLQDKYPTSKWAERAYPYRLIQ